MPILISRVKYDMKGYPFPKSSKGLKGNSGKDGKGGKVTNAGCVEKKPFNQQNMETDPIKLKELESQLYHREGEVIGLGNRLISHATVQDVKMAKLWKAYKNMGLTDTASARCLMEENAEKDFDLMDLEPFRKQFKETDCKLQQLLSLMASPNCPKEIIGQAEQVVVELMIVLFHDMKAMSSFLKTVCDLISICKFHECKTMEEIEDWEARQKDHPMPVSVKDRLVIERMDLIKEQLRLLSVEETVLQEIQFSCNERERIYGISSSLFLR